MANGYYQQTGQNAAVEGGVGDETLMDVSNILSVTLVKEDKKEREHTFGTKVGIDYYTSASSDNIDPSTITGESYSDVRVYPILFWDMYNPKKRHNFGFNLAFSSEYDYFSSGLGFNYGGHTKNKNTNWVIRGQAYFDQWSLIYPIELRGREQLPRSDRSSFSGSIVLSQVLTKRLHGAIMVDGIMQQGLLSTPYHRFFFANASLATLERLPESRLKIPVGMRLNYFLGDRIILKTWGRYYWDDWNLRSTTAQIEVPVKINSFLSVYPFFRYYNQQGVDYFYEKNTLNDQAALYYTSDFDLSTFTSQFYGVGVRWAPPSGVVNSDLLKLKLAQISLRYGHYERSTGLTANIVSVQFSIKPNR